MDGRNAGAKRRKSRRRTARNIIRETGIPVKTRKD
jgi:hypothetical protein